MLPSAHPLLRTAPFFFIARFLRDEDGATLVEYVLLVALIGVVCAGAVAVLGTSANSKLNTASSSLQ